MDSRKDAPGIAFTLNGRPVRVAAPPGERLSDALRERLGAREVKVGCNAGDCGACTVLLDGRPVCACLTATGQARGASVETAAGLVRDDPAGRRLAEAFHAHGAAQCGICIPGMITTATALLRGPGPVGERHVADALGGVLCRCTGYRKIVEAVLAAAGGGALPATPAGAVGDRVPRTDGLPKLDGTERFGDDVAPAESLVLRVVRSPHDRARFRIGDTDAYRARFPGLVLVLTAADVPGENRFGVIPGFIDQPVFAEGATRFRGEAVAAIVGPAAVLDRALAAFPVTWEELPAVTGTQAALAAETPIHARRPGNVMCRGFVATGDAEAALAGAEAVVEGHFRTGHVEHAYIEPEAGFARPLGDGVEIHACTQAPVMDQESVAAIMGLPKELVRIVPTAAGGGFGGKLDVSVQPFLALAAMRTGRAVRMAYGRGESMQATTKRHPAEMRVRIGADRDGRIRAVDFEGTFDTGAYSSWGPTVATRVPVHASGPYLVPHYRARATGVFTNGPVAGAFRGFGVPQAAIALECALDDLAHDLGLDPLEMRIGNALRAGDPTVTGQRFEHGVGIGACLAALRPGWERERALARAANAAGGAARRGVGVAAAWYGCGNTSMSNPSTIRAGITPAGEVVLHQGAVDIGQGANTVIAQIFAQALGVPLGAVRLAGADTAVTPDAGKTSASRQTFISGNAAKRTGEALRARILGRVNAAADARIETGGGHVRVVEGGLTHDIALAALPGREGYVFEAVETYNPPTRPLDATGQGAPYAQYGYAAHLAVVEVDMGLGTVRVTGYVAAHDIGRAINPMLAEGQIHGGVAQGLGMALMEEYLPGRTENLHDYLIPTFGDVPPIETILVEDPDAHGPHGAKGLGEHVLIPTAPAILNAIRDAAGVRLGQVPATPARVLAAIREAGHG